MIAEPYFLLVTSADTFKQPTYNHTREDSLQEPCPLCVLLTRQRELEKHLLKALSLIPDRSKTFKHITHLDEAAGSEYEISWSPWYIEAVTLLTGTPPDEYDGVGY